MRLIHNSGTRQDHWVNSYTYAQFIMSLAGILYGLLGYYYLRTANIFNIPLLTSRDSCKRTFCRDTSHAPLDIMDIPAIVVFERDSISTGGFCPSKYAPQQVMSLTSQRTHGHSSVAMTGD